MNRKSISILVCFAMLLTSLLSPSQSMAKKAKLKLNKKKVTLTVGKSVKLKVKGTKKKAKWKSSNKKIATVSSKGKVKAKKIGKANITAKIGKKKLVCKVTVKAAKKSTAANSDSTTGGSQPLNAQPTTGANAPSNPQATAGANGPSGSQPTEDAGGSPKPQATGGAEETANPQPTGNGTATADPQPTGNGNATTKPQPTENGSATTKPQPTGSGNVTAKPQPTENGTATTKPQPTGNGIATSKPQPTGSGTATSNPQPTGNGVATATPKATGSAATATPQATAGATQTVAPQITPGVGDEPVPIPTIIKEASFENGTDGFTASGNAQIGVTDGGQTGMCLKVSGRTEASDGVVYAAGGELTPGEVYTVQGYVKAGTGSHTLKCLYQSGDGADSIHEFDTVSVSDQWVKFMGTFTAPQDCSELNILFQLEDATTEFYLDEISILQIASIRETYDRIFGKTGTCINPNQLEDPEVLAYVKKHYSSITLENDMKPDYLMPGWLQPISTEVAKGKTGDYVIPDNYTESTVPQFNYDTVDKVLRIAKENGLKVRYHVLVWHSQSPEWFFKEDYSKDESAAYVSEEIMNARMELYIRSVINHVYTVDGGAYRDVVYTWDVVNEYFSNTPDKNWSAVYGNREDAEDGTKGLGTRPPFVKRAFELAYDELEKLSLADSVPLFYNDFNTYMTTDKIIDMIHYVNSDKKVCSGVGMQSHIGVTFPSVDSYVGTVQRFLDEDFQVQITELDVACVPVKEVEAGQPTATPVPYADAMAAYETQAEYVSDLMQKLINVQRSYAYRITGLTWWGLYDERSWVKSHALMFHSGLYDAKPSYFAFMQAADTMNQPEPTAPPTLKYDFTNEDSYEEEWPFDKTSHVVNGDGSITITFTGGGAYDFYLPESEWDVDYKSIVLTYTSEGGNLGHALYDADMKGPGYTGDGKHPDWGQKIKDTQGEEKTLILNVTDECVGGCVRGFQIFNPNEMQEGDVITITIKSAIFCGKENPTKNDLNPKPKPTGTPKPTPTAEPALATVAPIGPYVQDKNVSVPSGYAAKNASVAGTVEDITYDSTVIKEGAVVSRKAKVVLPKGYTTDKKYPVVYMQHGIFGNETTLYGDNTQYVIWNAIANGDAEEMIVVFPNACANEAGAGEGFNLEHYAAYDNFINDLDQCLMPYINEHYSTMTGRENTAVCGFSMGGRVSLQIGFTLQDKFRYIGGFCPTFGIFEYENYGVHEDGLFTTETFTLQEKYMNDTLVLIAAGPNDDIVKTEPKRYSDALTANGVPHLYYETLGGENETGDGGHSGDVYKHGLYNFVSRIFHRGTVSKPSPLPTPTEAAVTAPPTYKIDFSADRKPEAGNDATQSPNKDGSAALTFGTYQGVHYVLPDTAQMKAAKYRYVTVTYEGTGDEVEVWLYNGKSDLAAASIKDLGDNKKVSSVKLAATDGETAVTYSFVDEQPDGGFFRGIQLFHYTGSGTAMTVKSIVFSKNMPVQEGWSSLPVSGISGGTKGDGEVVLNGEEQVTAPLARKLEGKGKQVEVTVNGTLAEDSTGFRVWLSQGTNTASDQYYFTKGNGVGFGGAGDGDLEFQTGPFSVTTTLTIGNNNEATKLESADCVLLKAPAYGQKLSGVTVTDIQVREVSESDDPTHRWVTTWGTAEEKCSIKENDDRMPKLPLEDSTVRQIIRVTTGGEKLRLRLSNQYGESDVTVKSLHLAKQVKADESTIDPSTDTAVTVGGKEEFVIPKGKVIQTDAVDFSVNALENVAVTSYFGASPTEKITGHRGARATTYQVSGNHVSDEALTNPQTTLSWFFLADASIWSTKESKAVVCFGDSITDGYGTDSMGHSPDSYIRWGDYFAKRLQANDATKHISVINEGIGSNSIMGAYPTDAGKDRFARDLLEHDGVGYCIILFGVNDLNKLENTDKYDVLLPEYRKMIQLCHNNGIKVYGAPILPFGTSNYYSDASEEVRTKINNWMRSADSELDGIIDFESAVADPANPKNILEKYTHEDGLHPYDGYEAMADAIDLTMFQ